MATEPPKRRLIRLLRRTSKGAGSTTDRATSDVSAVWSAQERALVRARDAGSAAQRIASSAARQRASIDSVADRLRSLSTRTGDLQTSLGRVADTFERLALVALNAGLEGARLGEAEGRPLGLVSDEVRAHAARGSEAARELMAGLGQLASDLGQLDTHVSQAQGVVSEVTQDSARALGAASDAESALIDIGERVKKATGSDPETVRAIAEAGERARALVSSLANLSGKIPRQLLAATVRPALEPLARLLTEDEPEDGSEGRE